MNDHPPRPPLALAAGIVGHRPNRLPESARGQVAADIDAAIAAIAAEMAVARAKYPGVFSDGATLSLVGSLAEGADRFAARAVAARIDAGADGPIGLAIEAVLPFAAETFVEDFADDDSRAEFHALLGKARAVLELPGTRGAAVGGVRDGGATLCSTSRDIIIAVWDGGPSHGHGGTTETIDVAARMGLPIIFVDANGAERPRLHWTGLDEETAPGERFADLPAEPLAKGLPRLVDALLRPPSGSAAGLGGRLHHEDEGEGLSRYFDEAAPATNLAVGFPMLLAVFGVRRLSGTDLRPRKPALLAAELAAIAPQDGDAQDRTTVRGRCCSPMPMAGPISSGRNWRRSSAAPSS